MDEESIYQASTTGLGRPQRPLKVCFIKVNFVFVDPTKKWTPAAPPAANESLALWFMTQKCRQGGPPNHPWNVTLTTDHAVRGPSFRVPAPLDLPHVPESPGWPGEDEDSARENGVWKYGAVSELRTIL